MRMGRDELQSKIKEYSTKLSENTGIKGKISKAIDMADRMIREKK